MAALRAVGAKSRKESGASCQIDGKRGEIRGAAPGLEMKKVWVLNAPASAVASPLTEMWLPLRPPAPEEATRG